MKRIDLPKALFVVSCLAIVFVYGVVVGRYQIFPFQIFKSARSSVDQVISEIDTLFGIEPTHFLNAARRDGQGVTRREPDKMAPGLTLVSGFFDGNNEIRLIDAEGAVVNRWVVKMSELFPEQGHILPPRKRPQTDWNTDIHGLLILPDGSVVFSFEYNGMAMLDRCGAVRWTVPRMTHHSITRASDGGFWVPGRHYVTDRSEFRPLRVPYNEDTILKISATGEVLDELSLPRLLFDNDLQSLLLANGQRNIVVPETEIVHLNDIEELPADLAGAFPDFEAGDLLLSLRQLNLVLVVDPESRRVKWRQTGPWIRQHDPDFLPDGRIVVYNNNTDGSAGTVFGGSSILVVDPATGAVETLFESSAEEPFYSGIRGKQQVLPNGNVLVAEFEGGRIFEVTPAGGIVWEYINRYDADRTAEITSALRYPPGYFEHTDWRCQ